MLRKRAHNSYDSAVVNLRNLLNRRRVTTHSGSPRLLFLCGANKSNQNLSERRQAIKEFIEHHFIDIHVVLAEKVYRHFLSDETHSNLFDLETKLSHIADHIIIILEGAGAFCELGAFSHRDLRSKLIVINNSNYKDSESFINQGPLAAITGEKPKGYILNYPMSPEGTEFRDRIGDTYVDLYSVLESKHPHHAPKLDNTALEPSEELTKYKILFLHDLIYFCGKISNKRLVDLLTSLFEERDYRLHKEILAILIALDIISVTDTHQYKSNRTAPFFSYHNNETELSVTFQLSLARERLRNSI